MTLWVRFNDAGLLRFGTLDGDLITPHRGSMFADSEPDGEPVALADVQLRAPCEPRTFIGLWNNYHALAAKFAYLVPEEPLFFIKAPGSLLDPGGVIRRPPGYAGKIAYEGELGIVIGQRCSEVDEATAARSIFGYTCINDVTALEWLGGPAGFPQWTRAKGCDTFGPIGPAIATGLDWRELVVRTLVDGRERQNYPASDMILSPARIISLISRELTLLPGDVIACGTSLGVLPMRPGHRIDVSIDGIGTLSNSFEGDRAE